MTCFVYIEAVDEYETKRTLRGGAVISVLLSEAARILRPVDRLIKMVISLVKSWQIIQLRLTLLREMKM